MSEVPVRMEANEMRDCKGSISFSAFRDVIRATVSRYDRTSPPPRLNLVIPVLSRQRITTGGPATALRLLTKLLGSFEYCRIIVIEEHSSALDLADWPDWKLDLGVLERRTIFFAPDKTTPLLLTPADLFVATAWNTAVYVREVIAFQNAFYPGIVRRFVYLIQDYEPAFYPWSARHSYALSTYYGRDSIIPIFNSSFLADYFRDRGLVFTEHYAFEPLLNPVLHRERLSLENCFKNRTILVYGRPSVPRNGFDLVIESLRRWVARFPGSAEWTLLSAGEPHEAVTLNQTISLSAGRYLSLDEYALELASCWIGISFMFSPHPSYPPLEMAEFGSWVITNTFENKNLSKLAPNILSEEIVDPDSIAARIEWCCDQYRPLRTAVLDNLPSIYRGDSQEFNFLPELLHSWLPQAICQASRVVS